MKRIISILLIMLMALGLIASTDVSQNETADESSTIEETNETLSDEVASSEKSDVDDRETISSARYYVFIPEAFASGICCDYNRKYLWFIYTGKGGQPQ